MLKRIRGQIFLILLLVLSLVSPQITAFAQPRYGGVLKVAVSASPPTLDFQFSTSIATREVGLHVFESLVTFGEKYEVIPQLAERWEISEDGKIYTFYLRKGVLFHNGKEMTAEDVKASVERFIKISPRRKDLDMLKEITIVDKYTLKFHLAEPSGPFLAALASPISQVSIMPKEVIEGKPGGKIEVVGTGPYRFTEWIADRYVKFQRFKDYKPEESPPNGLGGRRIAYLDEILLVPVPEPGARTAGLETGEYDFVDTLLPADAKRLAKNPKLVIKELSPYNWIPIFLNCSRWPFNNLKMRQAVQAALNMGEIMEVATEGAGRLDPGLMFKEQIWHSDAGKELYDQRNPEKARKLLEEAGYKGEEIISITTSDYPYMYKAALVVKEQLKKVGMNVKVEVYDWPGMLAKRKDLKYWDMSYTGVSTRFDPSAHDFYFHSATTFHGYKNPKMDELIKKGQVATTFKERYQIYSEIQKLVYEDVAMVKLCDQNVFQGYYSYVKGYKPWYMLQFWNAWLEK